MRGAASVGIFVLETRRNQRLVLPTFAILLLRSPGRSKGLGRPLLAFVMMLRFIFWAFLSSASLPLTSQSPLHAEERPQPATQIDGRQWTPLGAPILAMTSAISIPWNQKRKEEQQTSYRPLVPIAMTSVVSYPGDPYQKRSEGAKTSYQPLAPILGFTSLVSYSGDPYKKRSEEAKTSYQPLAPILGFTSVISYPGDPYQKRAEEQKTTYQQPAPMFALTSVVTYPWHKREEQKTGYQPLSALSSALAARDNDPYGPLSGVTSFHIHTNAPHVRRQPTNLASVTTTLVTETRAPSKASPSSTSDSNPSQPSITTLPIPTKTGLANCNVQGTPSAALTSNILERSYAADPLSCQLLCMYRSRCEAYSFQAPTSANNKNCVFYSTYIDGSKVSLGNSGIYFSDKYPDDGSNFCYGSSVRSWVQAIAAAI
ncbi:hypothetical protein N431DRAFT_556882 [Stipitochalara longipes BDJ]|nr:hypothetical protein N431DRAFT_556882 [Stipitochalara longipes BDJ]